jgi:hypothetical protein
MAPLYDVDRGALRKLRDLHLDRHFNFYRYFDLDRDLYRDLDLDLSRLGWLTGTQQQSH